MTTTSDEYKTAIGLDSVYVALITQDDAAAYVADTPVYLAPVAELTGAPTLNEQILYYDNQAYETLQSEGPTERKLKISSLPSEIEAWLTGEVFDAVAGRVYDDAAPSNAPYFALGYRTLKSNGHYRYVWYMKGKFQKPGNEHATQGESPEPKPVELTFNAVKTIHQFDLGSRTDGVKRSYGDQDTTNFVATGWFTAVQTPDSDAASALTCTPIPADAATNIVVTSNITLTFNNAISTGSVGIILTKSDGAIVAGAYSWDTTLKVLTFDPTASLAAGGDYLIILSGVSDIYRQTLSNTIYNFTTAS